MPADVAARIQDYLRTAAANGRDIVQIGPFLASFSPDNDNPFVNYAIPQEGAIPTASEVDELIRVCRERGRKPRLEYIPDLAPGVESVLLSHGFEAEMRTPLMICSLGEAQRMPLPEGIELFLPNTDDELIGLAAAQMEAFGVGRAPDTQEVERARKSIGRGAIMVAARDVSTDEIVGGGVCTAPSGGISEIAGIGVRANFRRRGIAGAITERMTQEAFDAGVSLAFLMAGHDDGARVYARAGYQAVGEVLHISVP
ncbi:GNAT family N-acetyltransferase [Fimbriimonas ginsengisoli]|uniref:Acetyltransferase n=1 Tax=Fimbriimonas ginsengisoli Gsoil 348 TaxID=661478 RepID=A0A068NR77_FIMGI|nr:GNAT family N-acetyltransferase [Fimbriimonas ginsengisoli]AIE85270.1 acetyltransferase [Fimbriimonas ginsengisoli Gsoil 348]